VVDDKDHVCQAETSVHLAERMTGRRDFIRCTLADIFLGKATARTDSGKATIFSPFGLGILDLAVAKLACQLAEQMALGSCLTSFFPLPWSSASSYEPVSSAKADDGK
jgi:N-[(2S)-2-amino-2-carboxyethyl]-L-glutamate dehydrogenase